MTNPLHIAETSPDAGTFTVSIASAQAGWARDLVASLPHSLIPARAAQMPRLVLIDGREDWTAHAHEWLNAGVGRILILDPKGTDPQAVSALADAVSAAGVILDLAEAYAGNPAIGGFRDVLADDIAEITLDGRADSPPGEMLFTFMRLVRAIGAVDLSIDAVHATQAAFIAEGRALRAGKDVRLRFTGALCSAVPPTYRIVGHGPTTTARLVLDGDGTARPARVSLADPDGLKEQPAIYESGHRHALRALIRKNPEGDCATALREFLQDMVLATTALHRR